MQAAVKDITLEGPHSPVEVTLSDGETVTGELKPGSGDDVFTIDHRVIEVDDVIGFRA
ncbi:hypothetical protein JRC04_05025 [Mycolicibacterium sp. S2-37]|nr:hypothetical protein [Mycolicibacterium sp. S2-37]